MNCGDIPSVHQQAIMDPSRRFFFIDGNGYLIGTQPRRFPTKLKKAMKKRGNYIAAKQMFQGFIIHSLFPTQRQPKI